MAEHPEPWRPTAQPAQVLQRAFALYRHRRLVEAEGLYREILETNPDQADALHMLGVIELERGRCEQAAKLIGAALRVAPNVAGAHFHLGLALAALGRHADALASFDNALALAPGLAVGHYRRGNALQKLGRLDEAVASYQRALAVEPDHVETLNNCGLVLSSLHRQAEALACFDKALALKSDNVFAHNNRGLALAKLGRHAEAVASYDKALALMPGYANALYNRGNARRRLGRLVEAIADYDAVLTIAPAHAHAPGALTEAAMHDCDWRRIATLLESLHAGMRAGRLTIAPLALLGLDLEPQQQAAGIHKYVREEIGAGPRTAWSGARRRPDKLRVAYLSSDFREHAVSHLTAELYERHDRRRFEVIGVSFGPDDSSAMRRRLVAAFDRFHDVRLEGDRQIADLLRAIEVDIAVDLNGHTESARPGILARRPAPVQATWLGYPGTTGLDHIDYVIADRIVVPFREQPSYTERIVHLPDCCLAHDSTRTVAPRLPGRAEVGLPEDAFVFCCFNQSYKMSAPVFAVWMRLLRQVSGSVLWLAAMTENAMLNLRREAEAHGIDPARLVFAPRMRRVEDHLARHRHAGLFLDTLPYNAHTTAVDALWAGVPVVSCAGRTFAGRVAASVLDAAGLPELATTSLADYEALALRLARDPQELGAVRRRLADNRATCALFDADRFRRHMEAAFTAMWDIWQRGESPRSFAVAPS